MYKERMKDFLVMLYLIACIIVFYAFAFIYRLFEKDNTKEKSNLYINREGQLINKNNNNELQSKNYQR